MNSFRYIMPVFLAICISSARLSAQLLPKGKIASHNSLTYAETENGNKRIIKRRNRCQNLNIRQQYEIGVRMFDFRVRKGINGKPQAAHGRIRYKANVEDDLAYLNSRGDVIIRIMLENRRLPRQRKKDFKWFDAYVREIVQKYPNIEFVGGYSSRGDGKAAVFLPDEPHINQYIWRRTSTLNIIPKPFKYAKDNNEDNCRFINDSVWSMFDFVENLVRHEDEQ